MTTEELDVTPTEDLVAALNRRFDLFFGVSFMADPHQEEPAVQYWGSHTMELVAPLAHFALAHQSIRNLREYVLAHRTLPPL